MDYVHVGAAHHKITPGGLSNSKIESNLMYAGMTSLLRRSAIIAGNKSPNGSAARVRSIKAASFQYVYSDGIQ